MHKLWAQLSLGFAAVILVSILTVAWLTNMQADSTFRAYLTQNQLANSGLTESLAIAYQRDTDWSGAATILDAYIQSNEPLHGQGWGRGQGMGRGTISLILADATGQVIYPATGGQMGRGELNTALPITVAEQTVGYLIANEHSGVALSQAAQRFLSQINMAIIQAGLVAGVVGILLGLIVARSLAAPLAQLAGAARRIALGHFDERVPQAGPEEVAAVGSAFNEMAAALEVAEAQRRHMVADIAHELRTPLSVIQGNLRAILDDVYPLSKAEIATIYDSTIGLHRLVDDLRELSLAESGHLRLHLEPTMVEPLLMRMIGLFTEPANARGVSLNLTLAPDLPTIHADSERIAQVLTNFLANALRHSPTTGSIHMSAELDPHSPGHILIAVSDQGTGISATDLPHVFDRFWRADRSRSRGQGGSGLGLAIARQIVHLHGGQIGVESQLGQGSRFWMSLPIQTAT